MQHGKRNYFLVCRYTEGKGVEKEIRGGTRGNTGIAHGKREGERERGRTHRGQGKLESSFVNQRFKVSCFSNLAKRNITFLLTLYGLSFAAGRRDVARALLGNYFYPRGFLRCSFYLFPWLLGCWGCCWRSCKLADLVILNALNFHPEDGSNVITCWPNETYDRTEMHVLIIYTYKLYICISEVDWTNSIYFFFLWILYRTNRRKIIFRISEIIF